MRRPTWGSTEICKALKINKNSFNNWVRDGYLVPTYPGKGTGTSHGWSIDNLYEIELFRYLIDTGIVKNEAAKIIKTHPFGKAEWLQRVVLPEHPHPENIQTEKPLLEILIKDGKYRTMLVPSKTIIIEPEKLDDLDEVRLISLKKIERRIKKLFE